MCVFLMMTNKNIPPCPQEKSNKPVELGTVEGENKKYVTLEKETGHFWMGWMYLDNTKTNVFC